MSLEDLQLQFESPPSSVGGSPGSSGGDRSYSWEPCNIICAGSQNTIIDCRRCSIISGTRFTMGSWFANNLEERRINGKFNCHAIGDRIPTRELDNTFYVGADFKIDTNQGDWECYFHRSVYVDGDVIAFYSSDARLKDNVIKISNKNAKNLRPVSFTWRKDGLRDIGLIAQEVQNVFPEAVQQKKNGSLGVQYYKLAIALISSIQEKQEKIDKLKNQISKLQ